MLNQYSAILLYMVVAGGFLATILALAAILGPKARTAIKQMPFECGVQSTGIVGQRFSVSFYLVAMLFILFDIEVIFMYPWALVLRELGMEGFFIMASFMVVLLGGLVYVWKKGVLDWASQ